MVIDCCSVLSTVARSPMVNDLPVKGSTETIKLAMLSGEDNVLTIRVVSILPSSVETGSPGRDTLFA
ncbi:hypothetical protein D9M73_275490 [compost metagenome]